MNLSEMKCVMVLDGALPLGVISNTSAILGASMGKIIPQVIGEDTADGCGRIHRGIVTLPIAMLKGSKESLRLLRERLYSEEFSDTVVVDFSDAAQRCNVYDEYIKRCGALATQEHTYLGIAIYGEKRKINKLTGALPLLR